MIKEMSENEQMYLVTIARLQDETRQDLVSLSDLAGALSVQPVSVNQMVRKMDEEGLVNYHPYKGVEFTPEGRQLVLRILRYRRLWEVFMVTHLKMSLDEADALACRIEHVTTDDVADRLADFLGNPSACFHGDPIPQLDRSQTVFFEGVSLPDMGLGQSSKVMRLQSDAPTLKFLASEGLIPGVEIKIIAIGSSGDLLLETPIGRLHMTAEMAAQVIVDKPVAPES
jgi:DtxR family Mn-dependent transcriptional regulator